MLIVKDVMKDSDHPWDWHVDVKVGHCLEQQENGSVSVMIRVALLLA